MLNHSRFTSGAVLYRSRLYFCEVCKASADNMHRVYKKYTECALSCHRNHQIHTTCSCAGKRSYPVLSESMTQTCSPNELSTMN